MIKQLLYLLPLLLYSCEKEIDNSIQVQSFSYSSSTQYAISGLQDCIQYQILNNKYLKIKRTNVVFNCGLDSIEVDVVPTDTIIHIIEIGHVTRPANCNQPYDMEYTVGPLEKKNYSVIITEYSISKKTFTMSTQRKTGEYCVDTKLYP